MQCRIDLITDSDAILKSIDYCGKVRIPRPKLFKNTNFHKSNFLSSRFTDIFFKL